MKFIYETIRFTAAGAGEVTNLGFAGKTYMQEITKSFCDSSSIAIGTEGRLIDNRDGKIYWIAKQKDGLCWMTQNLDYDGGGTRSDISNWGNDNTAAKYYDAGELVYTTPILQNDCTTTDIARCPSWVDVSDMQAADVSDFGGSIGDNEYNAHYLVGNYYSWLAATNGTSVDTGNAPNSICPTGWSLPTSNNTDTGSFGALTNGLNSSINNTTNNIKLAPYYFVYGGYVANSSLNNAGSGGRYWSSTAGGSANAYYLYLDSSVSPSSSSNRYLGFSIRCVAR